MVHFPCVWRFKVGITSFHIGAKKRAAGINREMPGIPIPIMVLLVPGAYRIEQEMHRILKVWSIRFYKGDGASEWFFVSPLLFTVPVMLTVWAAYIAAFDYIFATQMLPPLAKAFFYTLLDVVGV